MPDTRSTRSRLRSASKSQSQSQSQSLRPYNATPYPLKKRSRVPRASEAESQVSEINSASFASASTASLPPNHTVHVALPLDSVLTESQEAELYIKGQELLTDGWRRGELEGKLDDLRRRKRAANSLECLPGANAVLGHVERPEVLWYTAGLRYPCTCELKRLKRAWAPRRSAPRLAQLGDLPSNASQSIFIGDDVPEWSRQPFVDLDPALHNLQEFEHAWRSISVNHMSKLRDDGSSQKSAITVVEPISNSQECRRLLKGKFKASEAAMASSSLTFISSSQPTDIDITPKTLRDISNSGYVAAVRARDFGRSRGPLATCETTRIDNTSEILVRASDDSQDADKRRAWWRREVGSSEGYGRFWKVIPRPHTLDHLPPTATQGKRKRQFPDLPSSPPVPDFLLPKYYSSTTSRPFQLDLSKWIRSNPLERVYWLIPIHGPVLIPTYSDHLTSPPTSAPIPSAATLGRNAPGQTWKMADQSGKKIDKAGMTFGKVDLTDTLLQHFWTSFLVPLQLNPSRPFGQLSVRLSGPKPDPFIDLPLPPPFPEKDGRRPVRVEAGDHMRLYVDAKYALKLRTWLRGVEVERRHLISNVPGMDMSDAKASDKAEGLEDIIKPFSKVRLALVDMLGEVLIVA